MKRTRTTLPLIAALLGAVLIVGSTRSDEPDLKAKILKFNSITGDDAIKAKVLELVKDREGTKKLLATADEMAKKDAKQIKFNGAMILARAAGGLKNYESSLRFFKIGAEFAESVKSISKLSEAYRGQVLVLFETKKYDEVENAAQKFLELSAKDESESVELMQVEFREFQIKAKARQGKTADALKMTEDLVKRYPGWYTLNLKGQILSESGKNEEAVALYQQVLERLQKAEELKPAEQEAIINRTRYILSSIYVEMNQIDKAAEELQQLLKKKPNNPTYNNDLGYIWADHDMNLEESEKLIRKALEEDAKERKADKELTKEEDRDKAAYLDSLGWVLFKQKKYAEAKKPLLDAVADPDDGQHIEIFDHLADVHMALGEKAEAIAVWKKALDLDISGKRDTERQKEVLKKLKAAEGK